MLITLQSNNDSDAASFSNHFKQNVIIPKDSKVALTDISYKFDSGITVSANTTFTLQLGTEIIQNITIAVGEYTDDGFVDALNLSLSNAINNAAYRTQKAYPAASQTFTLNTDKEIVLDLAYNPQDWDRLNVSAGSTVERQKVITSNDSQMTAGDGIILTTSLNDSWTTDIFAAGDDITGNAVLWGFANDDGVTKIGSMSFSPQQDEGQFLVGFSDEILGDNLSDNTVSHILFNTGQFTIYERNTLNSTVPISSAVAYEPGKEFLIEVEEVKSGGNGEIKYFYDGKPVALTGSADRWLVRNNSQLIPCGSFFSKKIEKQLTFEAGTFFKGNVINEGSATISDSGSGYIDGEYCNLVSGSTGELSTVKIATNPVDGSITTFAFLKRGSILVSGETISFVGLMSGSTNATLATGFAQNSNVITSAGTGYTTGAATFSDGTYFGGIDIIAVNGSGGITDFTWDERYPNDIDVGNYQITQNVSTDAVVSVSALSANIPSVGNLKYDVIPKGITNEPLVAHEDIVYEPSSVFSSLTNTSRQQGSTSIEVKGTARVNNDRETSMMLVNIDQFEISSICKDGGLQKAISAVPYGLEHPNSSDTSESRDGEYYYRPYNLLYQKLGNKQVVNHNQLQVRLTDPVGNPIRQLKHPTTLTIDIQ